MKYQRIHLFKHTETSWVVLVKDVRTGKKYVEKGVLKRANPILIHQWRKELDVLSHWQDPYIPELVDVKENDVAYMLVETYIQAETLDVWIRKHPLLKTHYRQRFICQMMHWMESLHQLGYVYVDLKPQNLLVHSSHLYLIDFNSCIEIGNEAIVSASAFNQDVQKHKREKIDQMGLKKMIRFLYPMSHLLPASKTFFLWTLRLKRLVVALILLNLSVFLVTPSFHSKWNRIDIYLSSGLSQDFLLAYKAQENANLYVWIENGWISKDVYENPKTAAFLIHQAIQTKDRSICEYINQHIPISTKEKILDESADLLEWVDDPPTQTWLDHYVEHLSKKQSISKMDAFLLYCLKHHIIVSEKAWKQMIQWPSSKPISDSFANHFLEYCLFLRSQKREIIQLPSTLVHFFEQEGHDSEFYQLWRQIR